MPITFGESSLDLTRRSLNLCSRLNSLTKNLGAMLIVYLAVRGIFKYRGEWEKASGRDCMLVGQFHKFYNGYGEDGAGEKWTGRIYQKSVATWVLPPAQG